jgi:hypothetical protein
MTKDDYLRIAKESGMTTGLPMYDSVIVKFASAIAALEREECAKIVARDWDHFKALRDAHYRHSPAEFNPDDFGINMEVVRLSERIFYEIRRK